MVHSRFRCFIGSDRRAPLCSCLIRLEFLAWIPVELLAGALLPGFATEGAIILKVLALLVSLLLAGPPLPSCIPTSATPCRPAS